MLVSKLKGIMEGSGRFTPAVSENSGLIITETLLTVSEINIFLVSYRLLSKTVQTLFLNKNTHVGTFETVSSVVSMNSMTSELVKTQTLNSDSEKWQPTVPLPTYNQR